MKSTFDIIGYLSSKAIPYSLEGKNVSQGWLGTKCPFCPDKSNHLGINLHSLAFSCFRCGHTGNIIEFVAAIEPEGWQITRQVMAEFASRDFQKHQRPDIEHARTLIAPRTESTLSPMAVQYLRHERNFPHKMIQRKYNVSAFSPASVYKFRLYVPVFLNERLVTFTTRAYIRNLEPKYLHFPKRKSVLFAKETLYNLDNAKNGTAIVVEGPTDAWRIGDGAVATFGVVFTAKQVKLLRERFKRVFVMYDVDAQDRARQLADTLACFSLEVHNIKLDKGDPGSLTVTEARQIRREIFGR